MRWLVVVGITFLFLSLMINLIPVGSSTITTYINDDFEDNLNGWTQAYPSNFLRSNTQKHDGSYSLKATSAGSSYTEYYETAEMAYSFNYSLWLYIDDLANTKQFFFLMFYDDINSEYGINLQIYNDGGTYRFREGTYISGWTWDNVCTITLDSWHHINGTFTAATSYSIYYDGVKQGTTWGENNPKTDCDDIGMYITGTGNCYVDQLVIEETAIPPTPIEGNEITFVNEDDPFIIWESGENPVNPNVEIINYDDNRYFYFIWNQQTSVYIMDKFNTTIGGGVCTPRTYALRDFNVINETAFLEIGFDYIDVIWWNGTAWIQTDTIAKVHSSRINSVEVYNTPAINYYIVTHDYQTDGKQYAFWVSWSKTSQALLKGSQYVLMKDETHSGETYLCKATSLYSGPNHVAIATYSNSAGTMFYLQSIGYNGIDTITVSDIQWTIPSYGHGSGVFLSPSPGIYLWHTGYNFTLFKEVSLDTLSFYQNFYMPDLYGVTNIRSVAIIRWNLFAVIFYDVDSNFQIKLFQVRNQAYMLEPDYLTYAGYNSTYMDVHAIEKISNYLYAAGQEDAIDDYWIRWANMTSSLPTSIDFYGTPRTGYNPLNVTFYLTTSFNYTNAPDNVSWDMDNDGDFDAYGLYLQYTYDNQGFYSVRCVCTNLIGNVTTIKTDYIQVWVQSSSQSDLLAKAIESIVWFLIILLPGMLLNIRYPKMGFVGGLLIMTTVLGIYYGGFILITITSYIGCALMFINITGSSGGGEG